MYKVKIEVLDNSDNNSETSLRNDAKYFLNAKELENYLNITFPYHQNKEDFIMGCCYAALFNIIKDNVAVYNITIEFFKLYKEPEYKNYAFGEDTQSIYEIFGDDSYLVELEFLKYMDKMKEREDCVDSWRIGLIDSSESMDEYWTYKTCCGSDDTKIKINGKEYMFGCNYGH